MNESLQFNSLDRSNRTVVRPSNGKKWLYDGRGSQVSTQPRKRGDRHCDRSSISKEDATTLSDIFKERFDYMHPLEIEWRPRRAGTVSGRRGCVGDKEFGQREIYVPRPSIACLLLLLLLLLLRTDSGRVQWGTEVEKGGDGIGSVVGVYGLYILGIFWGTFIQSQDSLLCGR